MKIHTQTKHSHSVLPCESFTNVMCLPSITCRYFPESAVVEGIQALLGKHKGERLFSLFGSFGLRQVKDEFMRPAAVPGRALRVSVDTNGKLFCCPSKPPVGLLAKLCTNLSESTATSCISYLKQLLASEI